MTAPRPMPELAGTLNRLTAAFLRERGTTANVLIFPVAWAPALRDACWDLIRYTDPDHLYAGLPPSVYGLRPVASHAATTLSVDRLDLPDLTPEAQAALAALAALNRARPALEGARDALAQVIAGLTAPEGP